jgi:ABC-type glycerol-3-phosphate transport system substrate-binding protein
VNRIGLRGLRLGILAGGLGLVLLLTVLAGCASGTASPTAAATPRPIITSTVSMPTVVTGPVAEPAAGIITLTIWTIPRFAPSDDGPGGRIIAAQVEAFKQAYPSYRLDWVVRQPAGSGGVIDFLLAAHEAAPAILPDIAVLDTRELGAAVRAGVLQPLDGVISDALKADLFPFARTAGSADDQWYAAPFEADIEHLIYNSELLAAAPLAWADVLSDGLRYGFPAGGENGRVNDMLLIQYMALGGRLVDQNGAQTLDEGPLTTALTFYADGRRDRVLPANLLDLKSTNDVLTLYVSNTVALSNIRSDQFLARRAQFKNSAFATLPTWNGAVATMGRGRAFVLAAPDPQRLVAAKAFVEWFMDAERNAAWTRAAGRLPTRQAALAMWGTSDPYYTFVRWQLASAYTIPSLPEYDRTYLALQQAVRDVLSGSVTPAEAARRAVAAIVGKG